MPATVDRVSYDAARRRLLAQLTALPSGAPIRLAKRTSNLFRTRERVSSPGLDVAAFDGVLSVDADRRTAEVLGMTTYEHLVDATLPHGLMPLVVPQLKTITLGGAVTGLGIESSSFRHGMPHESVREMEVMTGDGRLVVATRDGEHADLFRGFPNSYGTLGYALRLLIDLEPVHQFVRLRHVRFDSADEAFAAVAAITEEAWYDRERVDFMDGVVFGRDEIYLTLGSWADVVPWTSDYTGERIYYRSVRERGDDYLTVRDYLWRWDTDWFWCSRTFGAQHPAVRRLWPKRWLRSDVYWKLVALENRFGVKRRVDRWRGEPDREAVIQDVEVPVDRAGEFLDVFTREVPMLPVWLCPLRQRDASATWDLYALDPQTTYVNFGFWGTVPSSPAQPENHHNRLVERLVEDLGGRKSLYSTAYYDRDEFWRLYNGAAYDVLKKNYDPDARLLDLYDKCVRRR